MKSDLPSDASSSAAKPPAKTDVGAVSVDVKRSGELFGSRRELLIEHAGFVYRLRITQNNKLILTK